jgi:hypothetical protein
VSRASPHAGTFRSNATGENGIVHCEVLEIVPLRRLVYSWKGGTDSNNARSNYASRLDSVVTWTLRSEGRGTKLRMVHAGFRSPDNDFAYDAMSPGRRRHIGQISAIAAAAAWRESGNPTGTQPANTPVVRASRRWGPISASLPCWLSASYLASDKQRRGACRTNQG